MFLLMVVLADLFKIYLNLIIITMKKMSKVCVYIYIYKSLLFS